MSDIKQDFISSLYGQDILMFSAKLTPQGLDVTTRRLTVDIKRPNVVPAEGCDIIVHGSSTRTANFIEWNPKAIEDNLQRRRHTNGDLAITTHCYCTLGNEPDVRTVITNTLKLAAIEEQQRLVSLAETWQTLITSWE